jgi:RND superfamily putative drug exporter
MATLLNRLGRTAYRRWPVFIAAWILVLLTIGVIAAAFSKPMSSTFTMPGIPSMQAADLQQELFPGTEGVDAPTVTVVVAAPEGSTLVEQPYAGSVADLVTSLEALGHVPDELLGPVEAAESLRRNATSAQFAAFSPLSQDGRVGTIEFAFDVRESTDVTTAMKDDVSEVLSTGREAGLTVEVSGPGMESNAVDGVTGEMIGIAVALVILAITFGSLVAAGMPILTAGLGLGVSITGISALTAFADIPDSTSILASMLGLAVGIDYALFILARYRNELEHTEDRAEAMGIAVGTAGSAVVFAGLTVIIALAALSVVGIPFLTAMGLGGAATVTIAVLIALTLLPAIAGLLKSKMFGGKFRQPRTARDSDGQVINNGVRWATLVGKAPIAFALIVVLALGALALPAAGLRIGLPSDSTAPADTSARQAADLVTDSFGAGRLSPMLVVVDARELPAGTRQGAYEQVVAWAKEQDDVTHATLAGANENGAMILVEPTTGPESERTATLLHDLRNNSTIQEQTGTSIGVTGTTAVQSDISDRLGDAMVPYLAIVIGLAFLLLMIVFRSILIPLTATLGFLLSILATFGATVAIFQKGSFGFFPGQPIVSFLPIFMIGVVFGLAMDYQVFLVTRIREAHVHGATPREAVIDGFRHSARIVTAAALILTAVFSGFILVSDPMVKSMGFGLAAAIVFDAFLVRMCLVPALLYLMGEKAWWLPVWLDRVLPRVDVEGTQLIRTPLAAVSAEQPKDDALTTSGAR